MDDDPATKLPLLRTFPHHSMKCKRFVTLSVFGASNAVYGENRLCERWQRTADVS